MFVANFDSDRIDRTARKLHDGPAWAKRRHGSWLPLTTPEGARFWRQLAATWRDLRDDAPWIRSRRAVAETEQRLAETLIDALTSGGVDRAGRCGPVQLRRAEEFILAHLGDPILRADICEAAGVCTRSLSRAFARRHGVGPMTFLKQRRLEAAQRALLAADPSLRSVTEIAMESGLYHLGRFSIEYRSAFGESPSETLRR